VAPADRRPVRAGLPLCGVFLEQWRELFPAARTVELDDAGHFLVEDRPEPVTEAIADFAYS
jgi:pimeloyl-ACP methyl ester carboxylesterase